jgi:zinc protease
MRTGHAQRYGLRIQVPAIAMVAALLGLTGSPGHPGARPPVQTPAATSAATPAFHPAVLDNGLTVLLSESHDHPVVAVSCYVTTGGRTEDEYYQGSLHYIEHLVFKGGTPNLAPTEYRKRLSLLGREAGGWTWDDEINFGFEVPRENAREALAVLREGLLDLEFEEQWFEDEKRVVLQEMTRGREEPYELLFEAWNELAYNVHPYRRSVIGTEKAILELDMQKTYAYYKERFSPNHMVLSVAGDFDEQTMLAWIEDEFGSREPGPETFELGLVEPEQRGPRRRTEFLPQATTGMLLTGFVTPGGPHDDTPALEMLAALLNDASFGLPHYLVEQQKWVTSVGASHYAKRDAGDFRVFARMEPAKYAAVEEFVESFVLGFDVLELPAEVFEQTRQRLLFDEAVERASSADRAERLGFLVSRRGVEAAQALTDRYRALTPADVQAAKQRWITPRRLVTATVLPDDFDPATGSGLERVVVEPPLLQDVPDLEALGCLAPADDARLDYQQTDEAGGVHLYTFANGMRVVVRPTGASPLVAISGRVLGGQWVEPPGQEGINRFVAELGLRGTRLWDRTGFGRLLDSNAITAGAHVSVGSRANTSRHVDYRDSAAHHYDGLRDAWPVMLASLEETLFFPTFDESEIDKLRDDLVAGARLLAEDNLEYVKQEFYRAAYAGHPYGHATFGTEASLAGITADDLLAFHGAQWTPDRLVVSIVGDVDAAEVVEWVATRWADLDAFADAPPFAIDPHAIAIDWQPPAERQVLALGKSYWTVNWGRPGVVYTDPDFATTRVLARLAGNHHFYEYVYGEGVSYRSWISFWPHLGPGAWIIENDVQRDRFEEILEKFDEDLARYSTEGFAEDEFGEAVQILVNRSVLGAQDNTATAWELAVAVGNGAGIRRVTGRVEELRAVEHERVQALSREVFEPSSFYRMVQQ